MEEGVSLLFHQGLKTEDIALVQKPVEDEVGRAVAFSAAALAASAVGGKCIPILFNTSSAKEALPSR